MKFTVRLVDEHEDLRVKYRRCHEGVWHQHEALAKFVGEVELLEAKNTCALLGKALEPIAEDQPAEPNLEAATK